MNRIAIEPRRGYARAVSERKLAGLAVALAASAATMLVAGSAGSAVAPVTAPVVPVVSTAVVSDWVVLLVCLGYALAAWLVQAYRVVPPRDWLLERISYLDAQPGLSDPIKTDLRQIKDGIEGRRGWFLWVGVSKVQAGWRTVHAIEDDQLISLDSHKVNERLKTIVTRLAVIGGDEAKSFKERIDEALQPVPGAAALDLDGRRALLREAEHLSPQLRGFEIRGQRRITWEGFVPHAYRTSDRRRTSGDL